MKKKHLNIDTLSLNDIGQWPTVLRHFLLLVGGGVILAVGYLLDLRSLFAEHAAHVSHKENAKTLYISSYHKAKHLRHYRTQVEDVRAKLANTLQQLPHTGEEAELLATLSEQAIQSGLQFKGIKPLPDEPKEFYIEHPFEMLLLGSYHQLGDFMDRITSVSRIITFHDFSLQKEKNSSNIEILLQAKAYSSLHENTLKEPSS